MCVLAGELLKQAKTLLEQKIHPMTIVSAYRRAREVAHETLVKNAREPTSLREDLLKIAKTTMSSKVLADCQDLFAQLAVDAVIRLDGDLELKNV